MVYLLTNLGVADNSGARLVQCIKILGASNRLVARPGDVLIVVVKRAEPNHKKMVRGRICRALVVRAGVRYNRCFGVWVNFGQNAVVIVNNRNAPVSKRLKGPLLKEVCVNYNFLGSLANFVV